MVSRRTGLISGPKRVVLIRSVTRLDFFRTAIARACEPRLYACVLIACVRNRTHFYEGISLTIESPSNHCESEYA